MFVPAALSNRIVDLLASQPVYLPISNPLRIFGAAIEFDGKLPDNEIAFGFGETKPLRERFILA
jgi:hypothetical protein